MGSLADLIVATSDDAEAIVASDYALGSYKGVNVDGLDPVLIAALHSVLANKEFGELLGIYEPVASGSAGGPWLIKLPDDLISALEIIAPDSQTSVANQWASTRQVQEAGWSEQDSLGFLARLVHFAQVVSFEGLELFLCAYD